jgi:hypothetical protein
MSDSDVISIISLIVAIASLIAYIISYRQADKQI